MVTKRVIEQRLNRHRLSRASLTTWAIGFVPLLLLAVLMLSGVSHVAEGVDAGPDMTPNAPYVPNNLTLEDYGVKNKIVVDVNLYGISNDAQK